ncbi:hypothetical protein Glove_469g37 [Diversispora epigaea]|uniref:Uncharacterized protein n=1 Tax=Diversispora epigaea TaxID=1348612 RepID=A0A397GUU2_9GLOM|nr:hypothetical protein Glove_469g37 [Diversispora epigaea]
MVLINSIKTNGSYIEESDSRLNVSRSSFATIDDNDMMVIKILRKRRLTVVISQKLLKKVSVMEYQVMQDVEDAKKVFNRYLYDEDDIRKVLPFNSDNLGQMFLRIPVLNNERTDNVIKKVINTENEAKQK